MNCLFKPAGVCRIATTGTECAQFATVRRQMQSISY